MINVILTNSNKTYFTNIKEYLGYNKYVNLNDLLCYSSMLFLQRADILIVREEYTMILIRLKDYNLDLSQFQ